MVDTYLLFCLDFNVTFHLRGKKKIRFSHFKILILKLVYMETLKKKKNYYSYLFIFYKVIIVIR